MVRHSLDGKGYAVIEDFFSIDEIEEMITMLGEAGVEKKFGVRAVLADHPNLAATVLTPELVDLVRSIAPTCKRCIKSIYFDKPPSANWIVNWHQDLTINLTGRKDVPGYKNWRSNSARTIVQPDRDMLGSILTIRIHLDDCTVKNGALRVVEGSHQNGVIDIKEWMKAKPGEEQVVEVKAGGVLLLRPLTLPCFASHGK